MAAVATSGGVTAFSAPIHSTDWYQKQGKLPAPKGASDQGNALATSGQVAPPPQVVSTPVNPMQSSAYNRAASFESGLANQTNEETARELSRARDDISTGVRAEGEAAMGRGADPTLFRSNALAAGARNLGNLQARLADVSLGRRQAAIEGVTGAAGSAASEQRQMHLGTLAAQSQQQRDELEREDLQNRINQQPYQRLLDMLKAQGGLLASNVGITGGSSSGLTGAATAGELGFSSRPRLG